MYNHEYPKEIYNTKSAVEIIPAIIDMLDPQSVVDVGCGIGTWLKIFEKNGISNILGIESQNLDKDSLLIEKDKVRLYNLEEPLSIDQKFDLAMCLEVAEHIEEKYCDTLIKSLIDLSDTILFSAAIPYQGGQNHVNLQWPEYWEMKFKNHNYYFYDVLRRRFWNNQNVEWWYRQNMFLIIKGGRIHPFKHRTPILRLVHPELYVLNSKK